MADASHIKCVEIDCPEYIDFKNEPIPNATEYIEPSRYEDIAKKEEKNSQGELHRFYLTCPRNHIHLYVIRIK